MNIQAQSALTYLTRPANASVDNPPLLILLHGVGSNEESMHQLAQYVDPSFLVISARGPFISGSNSYRWYDVDFSTGKPVINAEEAEKSTQILHFVKSLPEELVFDKNQVVIGGFSQGGIMAYELGLNNPSLFEATISLSGRMMVSTIEKLQSKDLAGSKTLIIHGNSDPVLPIQYAEQAQQLIRNRGGMVDYHKIQLDHSISQETIGLLNNWLSTLK